MVGAGPQNDREPQGLLAQVRKVRERVEFLVASRGLKVPLLPKVANEVLQATIEASTDAARLGALIHKDPALAGQILRIANSAAYAPSMQIVSLQQAVARLGLVTVREVALAASVQHGVYQIPGFEDELQGLWRRSLAAAGYAKLVARARGMDADGAFLCGLLHRVGAPVVLQVAVDEAKALRLSMKAADARLQIFALADDLAAAAGASVGRAWNLPAPVLASMAHHDDPAAAGVHARDVAVVFVGAQLGATALAPEGMASALTPEHPAYELLKLTPADLEKLLASAKGIRIQIDAITA
jgi:HD-like signal output (HDOD) protein